MQAVGDCHIEINECREDKGEGQLKKNLDNILPGPVLSDKPKLS